jgi:hypothetical protein
LKEEKNEDEIAFGRYCPCVHGQKMGAEAEKLK